MDAKCKTENEQPITEKLQISFFLKVFCNWLFVFCFAFCAHMGQHPRGWSPDVYSSDHRSETNAVSVRPDLTRERYAHNANSSTYVRHTAQCLTHSACLSV